MSTASDTRSALLPIGTEINERGHLELGGCDAVELARELGTPLYVLVEDDLRARARAYHAAFEAAGHSDYELLFASKSLPVPAVFACFAEEGFGGDVSSGGELRLALAGGVAPARIAYHGNSKSDAEIHEAVAAGVSTIVIDAVDEVPRVATAARAAGRRQPVLVRVTPDVTPDTHASISTGQADSKFGVNLDEAPALLDALASDPDLELRGLHFHVGSALRSLGAFRAAIAAIAPLGDFPVYNLGGGLGVAYAEGERDGSIAEWVRTAVDAVRESMGPGKRIILEPGRSLVAHAGVTLYRVESVKRNVRTWVAVDGGMSDNPRPQLYGARYEALIADRAGEAGNVEATVAGKHCESGDVLIERALLPDPRVGDVLATPVTGAYGHAMASNNNAALRPAVAMVSGGDARVVVRRETYDDLLARHLA
ncbi:MAG: diaminopimelate decarboxylase [Solirubrobacteraceae bacterium]